MFLKIVFNSSIPIYAQIIEQIKHAIAAEVIKTGEQLPSVRDMAINLRINPNTVAKAYKDLEKENIVTTYRGKGVFVSEGISKLSVIEKERIVGEKLDIALVEAFNLGFTSNDVKNILEQRIEKFFDKEK